MLLKRSGMLDELERFVEQPVDRINIPECRMVLMFLITLARPGIWPHGYDNILALAEQKLTEIVKQTQSKTNQKMTMAQNQEHVAMMDVIRSEWEVLRRGISMSS